jgi:hypothetical protein
MELVKLIEKHIYAFFGNWVISILEIRRKLIHLTYMFSVHLLVLMTILLTFLKKNQWKQDHNYPILN